jgi:acyl-CoA thioester hydrolase
MLEMHETRLRVRYAETDQMGVVYHANYLVWMEVGRTEFLAAAGIRYSRLEKEAGLLLAVVEANVRYLSAAVYDDEILIRTRMIERATRRFKMDYELYAADGMRLLARGQTTHVFLTKEMKPVKLPEAYRGYFGLAEPASGG